MLDAGSVDSSVIHSTTGFSFSSTGSLTYTPNGNIISVSPFGLIRHTLTATGAKIDKICHLGEYDQVVTAIRAHPRESIVAAAVYGSTQGSIAIVNTDTMAHTYDIPWPSIFGEPSGLCFSHDASFLAVTTRFPGAVYFIMMEMDAHVIVASVEGFLPDGVPFAPQYFLADPTSLLSDEPSFIVEAGMACIHLSLRKKFNYDKGDLSRLSSSYTCTAQYVLNMTGATSVDFAPFYTNNYLVGGFPDSSIALCALLRHPDIPHRSTLTNNTFTKYLPTTVSGVTARSGQTFENMTLVECLAADTYVTFKEINRRINIPLILPKNVPTPRFGVSSIRGIVGGTIYVLMKSGMFCSFYISSTEKRSAELDDLSSEESDTEGQGPDDVKSTAKKRDVRFDAMDRPVEVKKPPQLEGHTIELQTAMKTGYMSVALNFSACVLLNADLVLCDSGKNGSVTSIFSRASSIVDEITSWSETRSNITLCSMTVDRTDLTTIACVVYDPATGSAYPVYMNLPQVNNRTALQCVMRPICAPFISLFGYVHINTISGAVPYLRQVSQTFSFMSKQASLIGSDTLASSTRSQPLLDPLDSTSTVDDPVTGFETDSLVALFGHSSLAPFISSAGRLSTRITLVDSSCAFSTRRFVVATSDGTVRLYEYDDQCISVVAAVRIIDTITSISCHPMGNIVAVACTDSVRLLITNSDSLVLEYEIPIKLSTYVRFNTSGGILSVLKGNVVSLYDTWTKHCIGTLEGHNDMIVDICRLPNKLYKDVFFVTAAKDGMLYLWSQAGVRISEIIGRIRFTSLSPYTAPIPEFGKYPPVLTCGNGCIHLCDFNSNLVLFTGYYEEEIDQNVVCLRHILYDDYRDIVYASDIDGRIHSLLFPDSLKDKCLRIIENSKTGMVGVDLQPEPTPLRQAEMKLPYVRFSTSMSIVETNLQATFGAGLMSTYRSGITSTDRQLTASSTTKRKTPVSVPTSSETQRQIEQPSDASDIDLPEVAGPQKHLIGKISRSFEEIQKTKSPLVVRLALSPDHKYLLVTSTNQNGCFTLVLLPGPYKPCIHRKFRELASDIGVFKNEEAGFIDTDILVDESYLYVLRRILLTLLDRTKEAELEFEHTVRIVIQRHEKAAEAEKSLAAQELESAKQRTDLLVNNAEREAEQYEAELHSLDRMHSAALEKLEAQYRIKVQASHEKHEKLKLDLEASQTYLNDTLAELMKQRDSRMESTFTAYNREEEMIKKKLSKLDSDRAQLRKEYQELLRQSDEDADVQLQELQSRYNAQLEELQTRTNSIAAETGMIKNKFQTIEKSILTYQGSVATCENTLHNLQQTSNSLKAEIQLARAEAEARNEAIVSRERLIYSLKKEAKDLEKHRFVLDFKIKELRKCIEPRETEISDLKEQIRELSNELENFHKAAAILENVIQGHKDESAELKNNLLRLKSDNQLLRNKLMHLEHDVHDLADVHGSIPLATLKEKCRTLFDQYGGFNIIDADAASAANEKERHQQYLVKAINMLTRELQNSKDATVTENARIVEENAELLKEAAVLRREIQKILHGPITQQNTENSKVFAARLTAQEAEIKRLKKRIVELQNADD
ncbi:Trichohyalin [Giardia duodenalis]|uniref:Trichohyalin n=1 Tax=Giardia intestinalis (strain ATCC 50803 / WB clone C6) TaxID=184922 RepID=A8BTJ9_GIAIC|nr:Trichohyalin [Giardia intestinalis]KAE8304438.1 Trichohyalin [Giardia intestinalis]|eukprot:XP_001704893.1 Trichohyalin [Giardia lamblia ATCC 50803]